MKLTTLALDNKQFTAVAIFLLMLFGLTGFLAMPRSEDPYIRPPFANIFVVVPGASPEDLEKLVLDPLDDAVRELDDIQHTTGMARDGVVSLGVDFTPGTDQDEKVRELEDKLVEVRQEFPEGVVRSEVSAWSSFHVFFVQLAVVSETRSMREMNQYVERLETILNTYTALEGIEVFGLRDEEVRVSVNPEKLAAYGISLAQVTNAIQSAGVNIPGGSVTVGDRSFTLLTSGDFESLKQIERVVVAGSAISPVYLGEIADVHFDYSDRTHLMRVNGTQAVVLAARQKPGFNVLNVVDSIKEEMTEFEATLPPDVNLVWVFDQSQSVEERISNFFSNLMQGIFLVGLVIVLALGWRPALVVMVAIPLSFTIALGFINMAGFAIQQMTIAAMVISLGLLVDNGIVVTENINTKLLSGLSRARAARLGTSQVGSAVFASTVTTILAFVPMAMMADVSGDFIRSMPISVMLILAASLLVALTVSPLVSMKVIRPITFDKQPILVRKLYDFVNGPYKRALSWGLSHRVIVLGLATLSLLGSFALFPHVGVSFFPKAEKRVFLVDVSLPRGSSLDATDRALTWVEQQLLVDDEVKLVSTNVGRGQPTIYYNVAQGAEASYYGQIYVETERLQGSGLTAYLDSLRTVFSAYPGAEIDLSELEQGPGSGAPIEVRLYADNVDILETAASTVENHLRGIQGVVNVDNPSADRGVNLRVQIDRDKAAMLGAQLHEIDRAVRTAIAGWQASSYRNADGDEFPIMVRLPAGEDASIDDFLHIYIPTGSGRQVQLAELATVELETGSGLIQRQDGLRMMRVGAGTSGRATADVEAELTDWIRTADLGPSVHYEFGGEQEARGESFSSMYQATIVAIVGIFAVLVLMFRSLRQPLIIFAALPLAFIGSILALFITGYTFSFTAFVGLTSLVGIVVNNSILLVDMTNRHRRDGIDRRTALIKAGTSRFVPILLTSLTTIFGLLPLGLSGGTMWGPMAWVIIGGLVTSTALTLIIVPVLYEVFSKQEWDASSEEMGRATA
jgi:multidrug efflux pump subunit AcrB